MRHANHCDRCNGPLAWSMMSKCNTDILCTRVRTTSAKHLVTPALKLPKLTREAGDYHFPGIGLSPQDQECLAARWAARKSHTTP